LTKSAARWRRRAHRDRGVSRRHVSAAGSHPCNRSVAPRAFRFRRRLRSSLLRAVWHYAPSGIRRRSAFGAVSAFHPWL